MASVNFELLRIVYFFLFLNSLSLPDHLFKDARIYLNSTVPYNNAVYHDFGRNPNLSIAYIRLSLRFNSKCFVEAY